MEIEHITKQNNLEKKAKGTEINRQIYLFNTYLNEKNGTGKTKPSI